MTKFEHNSNLHNLDSPNLLVPEILQFVNPKSVVDFGCGLGNYLHVFKKNGVEEILGINGPWVEKEQLFKYIKPEEFLERDIEKEITLNKQFDLVVSLEVAEHLTENSAETFVQNLVNAGDVILFSAAIPGQGGQNHINEQWLSYWEKMFLKHDYVVHDVIRPIIWDNPKIRSWYKQNMVFITSRKAEFKTESESCPMRDIVHYETFSRKIQIMESFYSGNQSKLFYLKLLLKSIIGPKFSKKIKLMLTNNKRN
jgi:SAM-dependent methyltransferase